jgi:hypothetical protein
VKEKKNSVLIITLKKKKKKILKKVKIISQVIYLEYFDLLSDQSEKFI